MLDINGHGLEQKQSQLSTELVTKLRRALFVDNSALRALVNYAEAAKIIMAKLAKEQKKIRPVLEQLAKIERSTRPAKVKAQPNKKRRKSKKNKKSTTDNLLKKQIEAAKKNPSISKPSTPGPLPKGWSGKSDGSRAVLTNDGPRRKVNKAA